MTVYGEYMKVCEDFTPNFSCYNTTTHGLTLPFHHEFLTKHNTTAVSTHPTFLVPRVKIKLKGHHFCTIEVIGAELQAVLNTLTENDFQDVVNRTANTRGRGLRRG
jgi:hypothetical protein